MFVLLCVYSVFALFLFSFQSALVGMRCFQFPISLQMQVAQAEKIIYLEANMKGQQGSDGLQLEMAALG